MPRSADSAASTSAYPDAAAASHEPRRRHALTANRLALLAAALLFVVLALFGWRWHWVEAAGTAERDGYAAQAEMLRAGSLPHDPYRPLLYPLLTAGLTPLTGDAFAAARLLSNLAAAALVWLAYAYGRRLGGAAAGGWAMALAAVNPNVWILGQHATTDMLFAALAAGCLLAGLRYLEAPATSPALFAGVLLGLAAFTRSNAVFLLPALLLAWGLAPTFREPRHLAQPATDDAPRRLPEGEPGGETSGAVQPRDRRRWAHLALAAGAAVLVLIPHWALRQAEFGNPFYDENWKNLAFKLFGYPDWSYLDRVPFRSLGEVLTHYPAAIVRGGIAELWRFATAGAAQLLGTWPHVLLVVAGAAGALYLRRTRRPSVWLLLALGSFVAATALTFFTWGRFLLLLLPGAYALAFTPWPWLVGRRPPDDGSCGSGVVSEANGDGRGGRSAAADVTATTRSRRASALCRRLAILGACAAVALLAVKTFAYRLPDFIRQHPYAEVALLRQLDAKLPPGAVLGGTSPFLGRYLRHRYVAIPDAFGAEVTRPDLYYDKLARLAREAGLRYLVIGAVDLRSRPPALLGPTSPLPWLTPSGGERNVVEWRVTLNK